MKNISTYLSYAPKGFMSAILAVISAGLIMVGGTYATFGPDRPVKHFDGTATSGFDHVTFNSFTGAPNIGDERDFLRGKVVDRDANFSDPVNGLVDGHKVKVYMYVHNGAAPSLNNDGSGVAKDLTARVTIPTGFNDSQEMVGFISASNAQPREIFDSLTLNGDEKFSVAFVGGSAKWTTNSGTFNLSDSIVSSGVKLGFDALDGEMPGCFDFSGWVTFEVIVDVPEEEQPEPIFDCTSLVADLTAIKKGEDVKFTATATAKDGATVKSYDFKFGDSTDKTVVTDKLSASTTHTYDKAGTYKATVTVNFDVNGDNKSDSGTKCAVTIKVTEDEPVCPTNPDLPADHKDCKPPVTPPTESLPNTGPASVVTGFFGTSALFMGARSWLESRKMILAGLLKKEQ